MKWMTFDLRTGRRLRSLPTTTDGDWSSVLNAGGSLSCRVPVSVETQSFNLRESTREWRTGLAAVEGDLILQAGPIVHRNYSNDELSIEALGFWAVLDRRYLIPSLWDSQNVSGPIDPDDPDWTLTLSGSYSDIVRGIVLNALDWSDGDLPIVLPDVTGGTHELSYSGFDAAPVGQRIAEITQRQDGPQVRFDPRFNADRDGIEFVLRVGAEDETYVGGARAMRWSLAAAGSPISSLSLDMDGRTIGSQGWSFGGRQSDLPVLVKSRDPFLVDRGWPLMDLDDREHANASNPDTLVSYMVARLSRVQRSSDVWKFDIQRDSPEVGSYGVGDPVDLKVKGDPFIPDGTYELRVVSISGGSGDTVSVEALERG